MKEKSLEHSILELQQPLLHFKLESTPNLISAQHFTTSDIHVVLQFYFSQVYSSLMWIELSIQQQKQIHQPMDVTWSSTNKDTKDERGSSQATNVLNRLEHSGPQPLSSWKQNSCHPPRQNSKEKEYLCSRQTYIRFFCKIITIILQGQTW